MACGSASLPSVHGHPRRLIFSALAMMHVSSKHTPLLTVSSSAGSRGSVGIVGRGGIRRLAAILTWA